MRKKYYILQRSLLALLLIVLVVVSSGLNDKTSASQLTVRSLTLSTAVVSQTGVTYTFGFTLAQTAAVQGLKFEACTTALGACTAPTGLSVSSATFSSQGSWTNATNFAVDGTGANDCTPAANVLCANRTQAANETAGARTIAFGTITNPSGASCSGSNPNCTFFVHITTYSTNNYTVGGTLDNGTVASSTTQTLTIAASIQEVLNFCIGSTAVDDATTSPGSDCSAITGTTVDLGVLDSATVTETPVSTTTNGNNKNGIAMLKTNASNGASVTYRAIQQSGTNHKGGLRVVGATCNAGSINTDQCIDSSASQAAFSAGTEAFGMTVAGTNCGSTGAYSCALGSGTNNLKAVSGYIGASATSYGTSNGYKWREDGSTDQIASSSTAVDDEALILVFAATPNIVTPTGSYQAQGDFIAIATY